MQQWVSKSRMKGFEPGERGGFEGLEEGGGGGQGFLLF